MSLVNGRGRVGRCSGGSGVFLSTASRFAIAMAGLGIAVCGCSDSGFDSAFVYSRSTNALIREAQDGTKDNPGLKTYLDERFGTPQDLIAWQKLPIDFGGTPATVGEFVSSEAGDGRIRLVAVEGGGLPDSATVVRFMSGASSGLLVPVSRWDAATGEAELGAGAATAVVASGDAVLIDGGSRLQSGRALYMRHCSHCHGTSGDGNGPTARYMTPRPRDYRNGIFKFTSTDDASRVSRNDLTRILKFGIPGTYMPSFLLMEDHEIAALVEYVRFLAMRGDYERRLAAELGDFTQVSVDRRIRDKEKRSDIVNELAEVLATSFKESAVETLGADLSDEWAAADSEDVVVTPSVPRVQDSAESRRKGRELYLSKALNCADCHGVDGAGNGPQTIAFEKNPETGELYLEPGLHDIWDNINQPRNLQYGIYRGGRRPIDLFRRIHAGIKGSRMPSFKNTPHEDIWHVVNYVLSIPFETEPGATGVAPATAHVEAGSSQFE